MTNVLNALVLMCRKRRQFDTSPTQGWGKVGARSWAGSGQGWGKIWTKREVRARSGQARSGQGWGKVGARSVQKARFGQGRGKLAVIPMYFTLITPPSLSSASITNQSLYHYLLIYSPISSTSISVSTPVSRLSPYLSLYLFYLFYPSSS